MGVSWMSEMARRLSYELAYRVGLVPWDPGEPDPIVVEAVEGPGALPPGRALDVGCGSGRNAVYLARHGWEVTGLDMVGHALGEARRRAAVAGVRVRTVRCDVTRLHEVRLGRRHTLLVDAGCFHVVPAGRRDAYAAGVTGAAAPGALLLMSGVGAGPVPGVGMSADELRRRFPGWRLVDASPVAADEMRRYLRDWPPLRAAAALGLFGVFRYRLVRSRSRRAARPSTAASPAPET